MIVERRDGGRQCQEGNAGHLTRADVVAERRCGGEPLGRRPLLAVSRPQLGERVPKDYAAGVFPPNISEHQPEPARRWLPTGKQDAADPPVRFGEGERIPLLLSSSEPPGCQNPNLSQFPRDQEV